MKKHKILAFISLVLVSYQTQASEIYNKDGNKLELLGKIDANHLFSKYSAADGDRTSLARIGFRGLTQITDELSGYGFWQYQVSLSNSEGTDAQVGNRTRLGFAGMKYSYWGSLDYGRNYGIVYDALSFTDMLPYYGGFSAYYDNFLSGRSAGVLTWRNKDFFGLVKGLNVALQYQGKNDRGTDTAGIRYSNGDGGGVSVSYTFDSGISLIGAYANLGRTASQNNAQFGDGNRAQNWATGIKYDANQFYLASVFGETRNATPISGGFANKAINFEAVAEYIFTNGIKPSISFISSKGKDIEGIGSADILKYTSAGVYYNLNKNMILYTEYRFNLISKNNPLNLSSDDTSVVGLIYQF